MKFKDKDGNVFEDILDAWLAWECPNKSCRGRPGEECDLFNTVCQIDWCELHPSKAARLMGYEVVEDTEKCGFCQFEGANPIDPDSPCCTCDGESMFEEKDADMDEQSTMSQVKPYGQSSKPRICEVLGVEVGEPLCITYHSNASTITRTCKITQKGDLVSSECRLPAEAVTQIINHPDRIIRQPRFTEEEVADAREIARLIPHMMAVSRDRDGDAFIEDGGGFYLLINRDAFPSVLPGQFVKLSDIVGEFPC